MQKCKDCNHPITLSWLFFSGRQTKYSCPNCGTRYEFTDTHVLIQIASFSIVFLVFAFLYLFLQIGTFAYPFSISFYFLILLYAPKQYEQIVGKQEKKRPYQAPNITND